MSKFNSKVRGLTRTENHEGAAAYSMTPELELYSAVVTTMMSAKFYETETELLTRIRGLVVEVAKTNPTFVAQLAVYARKEMNLRTVPVVLMVELAKVHNGDSLVSQALTKVISRVDEITETAAYYARVNNSGSTKGLAKLSNQIRIGLANAFNNFDTYQFAKYNRAGVVKLRDVLFLTHPAAKSEEQQEIFNMIAQDTLPTPETWEVELSTNSDKKAGWEKMIDSNKFGYMAALRNLRNLIQAGVSPTHLKKVADFIANPEAVLKSKQFPFRFLSAYQELEGVESVDTPQLMESLEQAVKVASHNIPGFTSEDSVYIAVDTSGSMGRPVSDRSKITMQDIGLTMAMFLHQITPRVITTIFGTDLMGVNLTKTNLLGNVSKLGQYSDKVGSSTNGYLVPKDLIERKAVMDKVVIFTDCQLYNSHTDYWRTPSEDTFSGYWRQYRTEISPNAKLYLFDLAGYGTTPVSLMGEGVYLISGWSERVFDMLEAYEQGETALSKIKSIKI